jgi:hypothetical protein
MAARERQAVLKCSALEGQLAEQQRRVAELEKSLADSQVGDAPRQ